MKSRKIDCAYTPFSEFWPHLFAPATLSDPGTNISRCLDLSCERGIFVKVASSGFLGYFQAVVSRRRWNSLYGVLKESKSSFPVPRLLFHHKYCLSLFRTSDFRPPPPPSSPLLKKSKSASHTPSTFSFPLFPLKCSINKVVIKMFVFGEVLRHFCSMFCSLFLFFFLQ